MADTDDLAALSELHDDLPGDIRLLLDLAVDHDARARALRAEAGRLLARLRARCPDDWTAQAGVDARTAERLLATASGRD